MINVFIFLALLATGYIVYRICRWLWLPAGKE